MKLLFLVSRFPYPPDRGDRLTLFTMLRLLSQRHEITLASFIDGTESPEAFEQVGRYCVRVETVKIGPLRSWLQAWLGLPLRVPSQVSYYQSSRMRRVVRELMARERFDVVFTHTVRMAPYGNPLDHPAKAVWHGDASGTAYRGAARVAPWWRRIGILWEAGRMDRYQVETSRRHAESWALSETDARALEAIGCPRVVVVPHGVDERLFELPLDRARAAEPRAVFLGNLGVPHNIDAAVFAARDIWPGVRAAHANARLVLAGANPAPAVTELKSLPGVEVTGHVADLRDVWRPSHVMIAPLRFSAGIQNKLLEAMAAGVPVISTGRAAAAIGTRHGEHLLVAETTDEFVAATLEVLRDPAAAASRAARAREHVRRHFTWTVIERRFEELAAQAAAGATAATAP